MTLLKRYLRLELNTLLRNNIRFKVIGRDEELAPRHPARAEGGGGEDRGQHRHAVQHRAELRRPRRDRRSGAAGCSPRGIAPDELDEQRFGEFLYTAGQPDPDLLIRTSGEMRVSNFLLWQIAYAEIWVTDTLWPDFRKRDLLEADPRLPETRSPLRRHQPAGGCRTLMMRVLSALVLRRRSSSAWCGSCRRSRRCVLAVLAARSRSSSTRSSPRRSACKLPRVVSPASRAVACVAGRQRRRCRSTSS